MNRMFGVVLIGMLTAAPLARAGNVYQVTSRDGAESITYEVRFGGGRLMDQFTAFDPETRKFVYLQWKRDGERPAAAMRVWDHRTGETVPLYRFPGARHPLPVIPSVKAMKVCPLTGDKEFQARLHIIID
ncbi:MAG: hypothetical protein U0736_27505 [Gemmataceae bacterium]